jgi:DNA-binding GntR family transcriptional regulator
LLGGLQQDRQREPSSKHKSKKCCAREPAPFDVGPPPVYSIQALQRFQMASAVEAYLSTSEKSFSAIRRFTLHDQIVSRVRDLILQGTLVPGSRIVEGTLGRELGVSRTPLREALKTLAGEGLIDFAPGRGAVVHAISARQAQDILEVLTGLEAVAGRHAAVRATDAEISELRRMHNEMVACFDRRDRLAYYKINFEIHARIGELSHNPELIALHRQYSARVKRLRFSGSATVEKWQAAIAEHEAMIVALEARDANALADVLRDHMRLIWERLRHLIEA